METSKCKKCGREIVGNKKKCDYCKKKDNEMVVKIGKSLLSVASIAVVLGAKSITNIVKSK